MQKQAFIPDLRSFISPSVNKVKLEMDVWHRIILYSDHWYDRPEAK